MMHCGAGRGATTVYNAANEVAVAAFIAGKIRFGAIARLVEATMDDWVRVREPGAPDVGGRCDRH